MIIDKIRNYATTGRAKSFKKSFKCDRGGIIGSLSNGEGDVNKSGIKEIGLDW